MKKYPFILLLMVSFFSCSKEGNLEQLVEKKNFDTAYLSNLQELTDLTPHLNKKISNVLILAKDGQDPSADIDKARFESLFQKSSLTEQEETEFLGMLKAVGFNDLESFYQYNQAIANLRLNLTSYTNISEKTRAEQEEVFTAVLLEKLEFSTRATQSLRDICWSNLQGCLDDAESWRVNCVVACAGVGVLVGVFSFGGGGVLVGGSCMAGCQGASNLDVLDCHNDYQTCVADTPIPPVPGNPQTGGGN